MTRKHWVRQMPWQLAAAGAMAGAVFGASALLAANPAFAECSRGQEHCIQGFTRNNNGDNGNQGKANQPQQSQSQFLQFTGNNLGNNNGRQSGPTFGGTSNGQTITVPQWQGNQDNQPRFTNQSGQQGPSLSQNIQQFVQDLRDGWQQPQQPQQAPAPKSQPPVQFNAPAASNVPAFVPPAVQQFVASQTVADPPPPAPVVQVNTTTPDTHKHSTANSVSPASNDPPANVVSSTAVQPAANADPPASPLFIPQPKVNPASPIASGPPTIAVSPAFNPPAAAAIQAPPVVQSQPVLPNQNSHDPDWWFDHHHHHKPHNPPPPPPPPPVVYPPVLHRTVVSCASVQPFYQQTAYPYGYNGYNNYVNYAGMPYGYNPYIYNQPVAPGYGSIYGMNYNYLPGYPYNMYPVGYNNYYNNGYFNNGYLNGYPYGNQYSGYNPYSNYDETVNTPYGILIIHHVVVICPQPVVQQVVISIPAPTPAPVYSQPAPSYQPVSAQPQAVSPQAYAPAYQQQLSGYIAPPRTGEAGLLGEAGSTSNWLAGLVLMGLLTLFSAGIMARVRQR